MTVTATLLSRRCTLSTAPFKGDHEIKQQNETKLIILHQRIGHQSWNKETPKHLFASGLQVAPKL